MPDLKMTDGANCSMNKQQADVVLYCLCSGVDIMIPSYYQLND